MGPLANNRRTSAMAQLVNDARGSGAKILAGGEAIDGRGHFFQPTVIADVPSTARIMNDEPFGPVAAISRFRTFDEAIEMGNRLPYGLAAYVFTQSLNRALRASDALEAGMVAVNSVTLSTGDAPFGGIKESGQGMEDGPEGLHAYLVPKVIHIG
jgi:succinate-semialdehyde dehydrogenase/glutarate-semialdehyde dehydrogenase